MCDRDICCKDKDSFRYVTGGDFVRPKTIPDLKHPKPALASKGLEYWQFDGIGGGRRK